LKVKFFIICIIFDVAHTISLSFFPSVVSSHTHPNKITQH
jgi:hypothetical protein